VSNQTLNLTPEVYQYYRAHACREPAILTRLREETASLFPDLAMMQISPEQGQFMHFLIKGARSKKILEIGTFTGYSAMWMAMALPADGNLITCDIDPDTTALARDFWTRANLNKHIDLMIGPAGETLQKLLDSGGEGSFDFAFIDADKTSYNLYYEQCLLLTRTGGIISIDNTLQGGKVADPENHNPNTVSIRRLNDKLLNDQRVIISQLPISDGLTLAYKA
jgi:predicted O-methyltransferase YrrM